MKISVVIPTYNSAAFIQATLESVLHQTVQPDEILVMDDGSSDSTVSILNNYKPQITVFRQQNKGVASARNKLCELAQGELIAFLDHDDIWHPSYLETQLRLFADYHSAVAFFTGHVNFFGYGVYDWNSNTPKNLLNDIKVMNPLSFINQYNKTTGYFASMSYCCIPKKVLMEIGPEPFCVSGADDFYLFNLLPLLGPVVYVTVPLVAYRMIAAGQSENLIKSLALALQAFELLEIRYKAAHDKSLCKSFEIAFASKRRHYAKTLMGVGKTSQARKQLLYSLKNINYPVSFAKSLALLLAAYMPSPLQPKWPPAYRESDLFDPKMKEKESLIVESMDK
ncbi:MAG TPA: glycosyltransferase family A protein [Methylobacter sp.]|jgi:glycosyltransferase involved in cell wall biosynthesis